MGAHALGAAAYAVRAVALANPVRPEAVAEESWAVSGVIPDPAVPEATKYLSVNTPVGKSVDEQCGKFVFADMHLYAGDVQPAVGALPDDGFPGSCSKELTPEEKALASLFFDLSSCVQDDSQPPPVPIK